MPSAMNSNQDHFSRIWGRTRKMGRLKYAFTRGLIAGLILFLFTGIYNLWEKPFAEVFLNLRAALVLLFWITGGIISYGTIMWPINEYIFEKRADEAEQEV